MSKKVTARDIKISLAGFHEKDYFITECKTGSTYFPPPQGLLKFDGLAITRSYTKPCITGYEIKVSRSDFLQDNKWHLYLQYCNEFYFVVPKGLISKEELPDNVGLIYYYPDSGTLRKKKKALWRDIEEPVGVYKYIIFSRLDQERIPFYESRAEYAEDYLKDKAYKRQLGKTLGTRLTNDLQEAYDRLETLKSTEKKINLLDEIKAVLQKHNIGTFCWNNEEYIKELEEALGSAYPKELDKVTSDLEYALNRLNRIKKQYSGEIENEEMEETL